MNNIEGVFVSTKYTSEQITALARRQTDQFEDFLHKLATETDDATFFRYVDALMRKIYILAQEDRFLTKTQACRMIPARNATTCIKYVEEAEKRGFISFAQDKLDKRRVFIYPSAELIAHVEKTVSENIDEMLELVHEFDVGGISRASSSENKMKNDDLPEYKSQIYPMVDFI